MTPAEFKKKARSKLKAKHIAEIDWSLITSTIGGLDTQAKGKIVEAFKSENPYNIGKEIGKHVLLQININVDAELDTIVAGGVLSLAEFDRIFGE
jgi:hypothetical protein